MPKASMKRLKTELKGLVSQETDTLLVEIERRLGRTVSDDDVFEFATPEWHEELAWRMLTCGMGDVVLLERQLALRVEVVSSVLSKHLPNKERRERALELLAQHYTLARGSTDVLEILMGQVVPAVTPERLSRAVTRAREYFALRGDTLSDTPVIHEAIMGTCLVEDRLLTGMLRVVNMLTEPYRRVTYEDFGVPQAEESLLDQQLTRLKIRWEHENMSSVMIALPHRPMATLTRETMNLGAVVRHGHAKWKRAALKRVDEFVILGDQRMVVKDGGEAEYIMVPLNPPEHGEEGGLDKEVLDQQLIVALTQALMRMYQEHTPLLEVARREANEPESGQLDLLDETGGTRAQVAGLVQEIPRVVAGIFRAARTDRHLSFVGSGEFIDSTTATRLTDIVGMSSSSTDSKTRVAAVRSILENVRLKRTVRSEDGKSLVTWEGPIIQRLKDKIDVETKLPRDYGLTSRHELGLWRIAPELWRMQDPKGQSASFMLLDERAFELSGRSSDPFNLYWTIIQRAYNAHHAEDEKSKFDDAGTFSPTLVVLYTWAGMDKKTDSKNMGRARKNMATHLDAMRARELIVSYDADVLSATRGVSLTSRTPIDIQLPPTLLCFLPDEAFRSGRNPFSRGVRALN